MYGDAHEKELWQEFVIQMNGEETGGWLYNGMTVKGKAPADPGYYIDYKICEGFYDKAQDKKQAVRDMLTIQDFKLFLEKSCYGK